MRRYVFLAVLGLLTAAPGASAAKRCSQLHQRDLAPATHVRLVEQRTADGRALVGCILPRGPVRQLATRVEYETSIDDYDVLRVAREFVLLETSGFTQYGGGGGTSVTNIRTGRAYGVSSYCTGMVCSPESPGERLDQAFLTPTGELAAAIFDNGGLRISAFTAWGDETVLDRGGVDAGSLRLRGRTATWTHAGAPRSARI